jgi:hypothetical protein
MLQSKRIHFILVALSLACSSCCTSDSKPGTDHQNKGITKVSSTTDNVELEISLPESVVVGEPAEMVLRLINHGTQMTYWMYKNGVYELGICVYIAKNSVGAAPTFSGQKTGVGPLDLLRNLSLDAGSHIATELPPGDSHEWHVDLHQYYVLPPRAYSVSAAMLLGTDSSSTVSVKNAMFTVTSK